MSMQGSATNCGAFQSSVSERSVSAHKVSSAASDWATAVSAGDSWQSIHNYGLAFDIVLLIDKDNNGTFETVSWDMVKDFDLDKTPDWSEITKYFLSKGYTNGFISNGKKWDFPHFQKDFGFHWSALKQRVDNGITIVDNGIVYPKI